MHAVAEPIVIPPGAGGVELSFGRQFKLGHAQGSGGLGLIEARVPPGAGFLPDWHDELIRELGVNPRETWEEIGARHHMHLADDHPDFPHT